MYENKIIFTMSDRSNHSYELPETENKLSEKEMNGFLKKIFNSDYIDFFKKNKKFFLCFCFINRGKKFKTLLRYSLIVVFF